MDERSSPQVIFRDGSGRGWLRYTNPERIVVARLEGEVISAIDKVERSVTEEGLVAAGFIAYEAAPAFDPALPVKPDGAFPLLWFGLFREPEYIESLNANPAHDLSIAPWIPSLTRKEYKEKVGRIHKYIESGDVYQVNFSYRMLNTAHADLLDMFLGLVAGQQTQYAAFVDTGEWAVLSASPELFFRLDGDRIESKPMKGTSARGLWYQDDCEKAELLRTSEKERAENLMIVDMVRNDIGRVAEIGSVEVPSLFMLERYPTLWQMTSTVWGTTRASLREIFGALFPPASVTGAPKLRAMEIISELESSPRRVYTGTIGWIAPDRKAQFSVAIRTLLMNRIDSEAEYGTGSGIVWDSEPNRERNECSVKAEILHPGMPEFDLFETMLWSPDKGYSLLEYHLRRLERSTVYFGFKIDVPGILKRVNHVASELSGLPHRVRVLLSRSGAIDVKASPAMPPELKFGNITIAKHPVDSTDVLLYHKTTNRKVYEEALCASPGFDDVILFNEKNEITETTIANIAVEIDGKLYTPPVSCGLLPGTYRAWLIEQKRIEERKISLVELQRSTGIYVMNSVRGIQRVELIAQ